MTSGTDDNLEDLIEDLIDHARIWTDEANEGQEALSKVIPLDPFKVEDAVEYEAAMLIRRFADALSAIADGADFPAAIARSALDAGS